MIPLPLANAPTKNNIFTTAEPPSESMNKPMGAEPETAPELHVRIITNSSSYNNNNSNAAAMSSNVALSIVIVVGLSFLLLNMCAAAGVFYQRDRERFRQKLLRKNYKLRPASERMRRGKNENRADSSRAKSVEYSARHLNGHQETEAAELDGSDNCFESLPHQSTSTMDPHVKVSQWMAHEIAEHDSRLGQKTSNAVVASECDLYDPRNARSALSSSPFSKEDDYQISCLAAFDRDRSSTSHIPLARCDFAKQMKDVPNEFVTGDEMATTVLLDEVLLKTNISDVNRRSTGRRKARSKSQLSLRRSITKRDVAVGNDEDVPENVEHVELAERDQRGSIIHMFNRLHLPKVLPDLPNQAGLMKYSQQMLTDDPVCHVPADQSADLSLIDRFSDDNALNTATIATSGRQTTQKSFPKINSLSQAVPVMGGSTSQQNLEAQLLPKADVDAATELSRSSGERTRTTRPRSRNTRSWYAQYSQSFISQSDQGNETRDS